MPEKSSFLQRTLSNQDAIVQILRPRLQNSVSQGLDIFERLVSECESLTKLGTSVQGSPQGKMLITAQEIKDNLDEFEELSEIATQGRQLLNKLGYVSRRTNTPMVGVVPVGANVNIQPIETQLPGEEPLQGVIVSPARPNSKTVK